jgi:quinol monooxygenase YgiN
VCQHVEKRYPVQVQRLRKVPSSFKDARASSAQLGEGERHEDYGRTRYCFYDELHRDYDLLSKTRAAVNGFMEDSVLALVEEHGGTMLHRARSDSAEGQPLEIQLYEWASQAAMDSYMSDPRRRARAAERDRAVARTEIVPVRLV